ncbi:hypothetical protein [Falsirhodobacter halotolerans]|uniref:hypothetical protein n=1 Tax=Falsirhodobacter halotolerans TaxID=1146892 RepID=UPI001FD47C63|nr:hypothetical protein [Falsirhodobacter halotolerans]MCJ8139491.1 hypothetical protein [Falsirhodobacter halotolerans]
MMAVMKKPHTGSAYGITNPAMRMDTLGWRTPKAYQADRRSDLWRMAKIAFGIRITALLNFGNAIFQPDIFQTKTADATAFKTMRMLTCNASPRMNSCQPDGIIEPFSTYHAINIAQIRMIRCPPNATKRMLFRGLITGIHHNFTKLQAAV